MELETGSCYTAKVYKRIGFEVRQTRVQISTVPLASSVIWQNLLGLPKPVSLSIKWVEKCLLDRIVTGIKRHNGL